MQTSQSKLSLPQIKKVGLRRFSLFTANPDVEFECGNGVLCLIGANGIGKSTLLSAINFCLTGIVSEPGREFRSMEEYYEYSLGYSANYFRGRITESDREEAEIALWFQVGNYEYKIKRGLFEPEELRELCITNVHDGSPEFSNAENTQGELHQQYTIKLTKHVGLSTFAEFVFLQHFVFTFDERRLTLFWNQKILERVLYLAFGLAPDMAKKVDAIKREFDSADSQVRNRQWDATKTTKRINELRTKLQAAAYKLQNYDNLASEHEKLSQTFNREMDLLDSITKQIRDANLRLSGLSANEAALRDEYSQFFDKGFERRPPLAQHPLLTKGITDHVCALCGAIGEDAERGLRSKLNAKVCPLCDSAIPTEKHPKEKFERLKEIDSELVKIKHGMNELSNELERLKREELDISTKVQDTKKQLSMFEQENEDTMLLMKQTDGAETLLTSYSAQLEKMLEEKKDAEKRRTKCRERLIDLQKKLQKHYLAGEKEFVPAFTDLAHLFLGMDMHVRMEASEASGLNLVVEVRGTTRRLPHNLSESQRFFLDIALRMALIKFISDTKAKGTLFLDTPEGSLDIAYEKRAGDMLARFVTAGHRVIMSANINTSNLLLALARSCTDERMRICRMTDWAELSEVQREEEGLFKEAYAKIEEALKS